jgi:hypothetical protein
MSLKHEIRTMSLTVMYPVENTIAFVGVAAGKRTATLVDNVIGINRYVLFINSSLALNQTKAAICSI